MTNFYRRPKIGLVLSGGAGRGNAHIGVLKVLERENIPIDCLVAVSMGGIIAAGYAGGLSPQAMEEEALRMASLPRLLNLVDRKLLNGGLVAGKRIRDYMAGHIGRTTTFDDLRIPLALMSVDLNSGREIILRHGNVADAVRATIAIPGLIAPMEMNGYRLVDGGLLNNLPVDVARQMGAEVVIAVDVMNGFIAAEREFGFAGNRFVPDRLGRIAGDAYRSLSIAMRQLNQYKLKQAPPDVLIKPTANLEINFLTRNNSQLKMIRSRFPDGLNAASPASLPSNRRGIRSPRLWRHPDPTGAGSPLETVAAFVAQGEIACGS
ncbi:MAG: hypothetical protein B6243_10275 [Anaerolineaceae bacterium 4572_5.2]|nr:MAG: hypothetical protein B6243_10275 [Anaerolineaceae bacterium 4572_5.2]